MNGEKKEDPLPRFIEDAELTILMPCLNEADTVGKCVAKATRFLTENDVTGEVVVADNGSTDGSQGIAENFGARVIVIPRRGYGAALIGGIEAAQGRYIIMGDSDDSYDFSKLMPFLEQLRGGADLVMGNRFKGGIADGAMPWLHRYFGNPILSFMGRLFFNIRIGDFHCGLRGFNTKAIRSLGLVTTGMEFASEMVVRSQLAGLVIQEVPSTLAVHGRKRRPHLNTWQDGWRHLKFLLMYSPRWLFLVPGAGMVLLGIVSATILILGPLPIGSNLTLDFNTFAAACFSIVVGTQLLTFGAIARLIASRAGFLPKTRAANWVSTDRLVQIAGCVLAIGAVGLSWAMWQWMKIDFGPLTSPLVSRILVGSLCSVVVAIQTAGSALLLSVLEISLREGVRTETAHRFPGFEGISREVENHRRGYEGS